MISDERIEQVEAAYREIRYQSLIVDEARRAQGRDGDSELTYGTTTARLAWKILELLGAGSEDVFYDLGCGLGVPTIVAALVCRKATGIEVLPQLLEHARAVAATLQLDNAHFVNADLRTADLGDGSVFYSYSTCLSQASREAMAAALAKARSGARIATVTHSLEHPELRLVKKVELRWGATSHSVFLHERV